MDDGFVSRYLFCHVITLTFTFEEMRENTSEDKPFNLSADSQIYVDAHIYAIQQIVNSSINVLFIIKITCHKAGIVDKEAEVHISPLINASWDESQDVSDGGRVKHCRHVWVYV